MINNVEYTDVIFFCYTAPAISLFVFFQSILCFIIFSNKIFKEKLYPYLKLDALFISLDMLIGILKPIFHCETTLTKDTLFSNIFFVGFIHYGASVLENSAFMCCILSTFEFYVLVSEKLGKSKFYLLYSKINYKIKCFIVFLFSVLLFLYQIFEFEIVNTEESYLNVTKYKYTKKDSSFRYSTFYAVNQIIVFSLRDFLNNIILIVLNVLIFFSVKQSIINKKNIRTISKDLNKRKNSIKTNLRIRNAKHSIKLMIYFGGINNIVGRLPLLVYFLLNSHFPFEQIHLILKFGVIVLLVSYSFHFILYFFTNKLFRKLCYKYVSLFFHTSFSYI